jgi:hypothetical protein
MFHADDETLERAQLLRTYVLKTDERDACGGDRGHRDDVYEKNQIDIEDMPDGQ